MFPPGGQPRLVASRARNDSSGLPSPPTSPLRPFGQPSYPHRASIRPPSAVVSRKLRDYVADALNSPPESPSSDSDSAGPPSYPYAAGRPPISPAKAHDRGRERRESLQPRSAVANFFNLDFSFLHEEPPAARRRSSSPFVPVLRPGEDVAANASRKSSLSGRVATGGSTKPWRAANQPGSPESCDDSDRSFSWSTQLDLSRDGVSSRADSPLSSLPTSRLPFPTRLTPSHRRPSLGGQLAESAHVGTTSRPLLLRMESDGSLRFTLEEEHRRPSVDSLDSSLSLGSSAGGPSLREPFPRYGEDENEKRKRLVLFLDETASTMESSPKVLPPRFDEDLFTHGPSSAPLPDLEHYSFPRSSTSSPSPRSSASAGPSPQSPPIPLHFILPPRQRTSGIFDQDRPNTVYFTPTVPHASVVGDLDEYANLQKRSMSEDLRLGLDVDLDLDLDVVPFLGTARRPSADRSPSTVRAVNSPRFPPPLGEETLAWEPSKLLDPIEGEAGKAKVKMAEKRRRTIRELVETEAVYASDMAIVRDIWLARARGADLGAIADHVMSTGLGLGKINVGLPSPPLSATNSTFPANRRPSILPRISTSPDAGEPVISAKDVHTIFANLDEVACLAEAFSEILDGACGRDDDDDTIGAVFVEMLPRIQQVFSIYCARHHRAILKLGQLAPSLKIKTYSTECQTLSHGRTGAWDLASLLIKPVQRVLKYPMLLASILAVTPSSHPDRISLERACTDILMVADHINEVKTRELPVVLSPTPGEKKERRSSTASSLTKKLLGGSSSRKSKTPTNAFPEQEGNDMFDTLSALVDSTRSSVLRIETEMREHVRKQLRMLESHASMVDGWIEYYSKGAAPMLGSGGYERLCTFLDTVLRPLIAGAWRDLDHAVRREFLIKTEHLLSMFENPRSVITKRNNKMLDHSRYLAKRLSTDRVASEEFLVLSSQLLGELPSFLGNVTRYLKIIQSDWDAANAVFASSVVEAWLGFAERLAAAGEDDDAGGNEDQSTFHLMDALSSGLHMSLPVSDRSSSGGPSIQHTPSRPHSSASSARRLSARYTAPSAPSTPESLRAPRPPGPSRLSSHGESQVSGAPRKRSSLISNSSTAMSISLPPVDSPRRSEFGLATPRLSPPPLPLVAAAPLATVYTSGCSTPRDDEEDPGSNEDTFDEVEMKFARPRPTIGRTSQGRPDSLQLESRYLSAYDTVYVAAEDGYECGGEQETCVLYLAMAMGSTRAVGSRSGHPLLSYEIGDRLHVELEEADKTEGGAGWLLGRIGVSGRLGWARTEHFHLI